MLKLLSVPAGKIWRHKGTRPHTQKKPPGMSHTENGEEKYCAQTSLPGPVIKKEGLRNEAPPARGGVCDQCQRSTCRDEQIRHKLDPKEIFRQQKETLHRESKTEDRDQPWERPFGYEGV